MSDRLSVIEIRWRGLPAWTVVGSQLSVVVTQLGAQVAALVAHSEGSSGVTFEHASHDLGRDLT